MQGRAILLDRSEAQTLHEMNRRRHNARVLPFLSKMANTATTGTPNLHAAKLAADALAAKSLTDSYQECWGHFSARIVLLRSDTEQLEADIKEIEKCLDVSHIGLRQESYNVIDAWNGSLPGHAFYDVRQVPIRGFNVAGMSPLHTTWTGTKYNQSNKMPARSSPLFIASTNGVTPYKHQLHVQDVGHTGMFGPTGNGKSTFFGFHAVSQLRYAETRIYMFDRMRTQYVLCKAVGGKHYDFGRDKSLTLCPLQYLETASDRAWAANYIELLCIKTA